MTNRELIRFLRTNYHITQSELAKNIIGENGKPVSRNYINMIENGTGNVQLSNARAEEIINVIYKVGEEKKKEENKIGDKNGK